MKPVTKEFLKRSILWPLFYLCFGVLGGNTLTHSGAFTIVFLIPLIIYVILIPWSRFNVNIYLISNTYLFVLGFICLLSAIVFTLFPVENAMYYYSLPAPDNYIALVFCTLPFIALFVHMLSKGCKSLNEVAEVYIQKQRKIDLKTSQYFLNQKINILRDAQKKSMYDFKLEKFLAKHVNLVYRIIMITSVLGPIIPILILRNSGEQPLNYYFLTTVAYITLICAYFLPITIHMTRTVLYIQKKHNIKLKLAYKDDKDIIIV